MRPAASGRTAIDWRPGFVSGVSVSEVDGLDFVVIESIPQVDETSKDRYHMRDRQYVGSFLAWATARMRTSFPMMR